MTPTLVSATPLYDLVNDGWAYIGVDSNNQTWTRSVKGDWGVAALPALFTDLQADFATYQASKQPTATATVESDNAGQTVTPPAAQAVQATPS